MYITYVYKWGNNFLKFTSLLISCREQQTVLYNTALLKFAAYTTVSLAPWTICRIKDLSTYLIYLFLVLASDRRRCRFRRGGGDDLLRSIEEWKFEKTPASTKRRGALNILPGRTYPGPAGGFCPGTFVRSFRITRTPISCERGKSDGGAGRSLEERFVRETKAIRRG